MTPQIEMLTREHLKVLKYLKSVHGEMLQDVALRNATKIYDFEDMEDICKELYNNKYLDKLRIDADKTIVDVHLSYKGRHYRKYIAKARLHAVGSWFASHIVELVALILSLIALIRTI